VRAFLVVEGEELIQSSEPLVVFFVGLEELFDLPTLTVRFGELLDPPPTDLELLSNQPSIHAVVNNSLTDSGSVILSKFHLTWLIVGQIATTKSLADTTGRHVPQSKQTPTQ
jgi:hypothetical protein